MMGVDEAEREPDVGSRRWSAGSVSRHDRDEWCR